MWLIRKKRRLNTRRQKRMSRSRQGGVLSMFGKPLLSSEEILQRVQNAEGRPVPERERDDVTRCQISSTSVMHGSHQTNSA